VPPSAARIWIATRKGIFLAIRASPRADWQIEGPGLPGYEVYHVAADPDRPEHAYAVANHPVWGNHVFHTTDSGGAWTLTPAAMPSGREVRGFWHMAVGPEEAGGRRWYLGVDPGGLLVTRDPTGDWSLVGGLEDEPTRSKWQVARGGMPLHSIQIDPHQAARIYVAISAGGCYRSEDGGASWKPINDGIRAEYLADPASAAGHNPHALRLHPANPDRLYRQDHCGVYRSDDRGDSWIEITGTLPSEFGYALGLDPSDPDRAWVIPEESSHMRCVCEARLRVYETSDAGGSWVARTLGLPQRHAYVSVLRDALAVGEGGLALGTTTGQAYWSSDGLSWEDLPGLFPTVLAVAVVRP